MARIPAPPSPARRVLADKTPNASIRRAHEPMPKPHLDHAVFEEHRDFMKCSVGMEVDRGVSPKAGQKRRIHQVDGTEEQEQQEQHERERASPALSLTVLPTEPNSETDERGFLSTSQSKSSMSSVSTSFHISQESSGPVEDQFEIQDEMSQQTLDKIVSYVRIWWLKPDDTLRTRCPCFVVERHRLTYLAARNVYPR